MTSFTTTRFNNETWNENLLYRENANFHGCIYGAPQDLSPRIEPKSLVFVVSYKYYLCYMLNSPLVDVLNNFSNKISL